METVNDGTLRELAIRLPLCISKRFGILSEEELEIKTLLSEGFNLVPLSVLPSTSCVADGSVPYALPEAPISQMYIGADRVAHIIGFVNWMLDKEHYTGSLAHYFREKARQLKEYDSLVRCD